MEPAGTPLIAAVTSRNQADLRRQRLDDDARHRLTAVLGLGPWCWPENQDARAVAGALVREGPHSAVPGTALLLAVNGPNGSLWAITQNLPRVRGKLVIVPFTAEAIGSWNDAILALERSLPAFWGPVAAAREPPREACLLDEVASDAPVLRLDGRSFGLPFLLAAASRLLGEPMPSDLVATGAVRSDGSVEAVEGIAVKVAALAACAPAVRRLVVPAGNLAEAAREIESLDAEISAIGVSSAAEAFQIVYCDSFEARIRDAGGEPKARRAITRSLRDLALSGRGAILLWESVRVAAEIALNSWPEVGAFERCDLELARGVAARHDGLQGTIAMPDPRWLESLHESIRLDVMAQLVQCSADWGTPPPDEILPVAKAMLVDDSRMHPAHLRLQGAIGRLLAFRGDMRTALDLQRRSALAAIAGVAPGGASMPLCEWFRLAGIERDLAEIAAATAAADEAESLGALQGDDWAYLSLARARAFVAAGHDLGSAVQGLLVLGEREDVAPHVRWSALRWALRGLTHAGRIDEASAPRLSLERGVARGGSDGREARTFLALANLDRGIFAADSQLQAEAIAYLREAEGALVCNIEETTSPHEHAAAIADRFPY